MNVDDYLKKINCTGLKNASLENLKLLQTNHMQSIAFENLDIYLGKHIKFSLQDAYNKVMSGLRGGYCLEINPLFGWLISNIGYDFYYAQAHVYNAAVQKYTKYKTHIVLVVKLDQKDYYVDVVSSFMASEPIEIVIEKPIKQKFGTFKFIKNENDFLILQRSPNKEFINNSPKWTPLMKIFLEAKSLESFAEMNEIVQDPIRSTIANRSMCTLCKENSVFILIGWKYSVINFKSDDEEERLDKIVENVTEMREILAKKFGVIVDESLSPKENTLPQSVFL